ncbi:uncharacterized protein LOC142222584 isoform X2 [Haematobia irritans]|uniref:uncharacterized protein LOC142222584 isoform X2 n=1 Tax=Haematobia irritans TaxID=7368 RepID=UPI003F4FC155
MKRFCVICKATMGGRATLYSFRPQNKAEWCNVLGLDPNKIPANMVLYETHTERLAYGNPSEMMEDYVPLEHLAMPSSQIVEPSLFVRSNFEVNEYEAGDVESPLEQFNENAQEYVPEMDSCGVESPDNECRINILLTTSTIRVLVEGNLF